MFDHLLNHLQRIRARARRLLWLRGASQLIALLIGSILLAGWVDWLLHLDDPVIRLQILLAIIAVSAWVGWKGLVIPLRRRLTELDIAFQIEALHPELNDALSTAVQFSQTPNDDRFGSVVMQRQAIARAVNQTARIPLDHVLQTAGVRRAAMVAALVCLLAAGFVGLDQASASVALIRLLRPFGAPEWPTQVQLRLLDARGEVVRQLPHEPFRKARAETLELYVENTRGTLPGDLSLEIRRLDGSKQVRRLRPTLLRLPGSEPREVAQISIAAEEASVQFRVTGGDFLEMPFYELTAIPPPTIEKLQVVLVPPAYLGHPVERLPVGVGHLRGLVGTRVIVDVTADKPLREARLRIRDKSARPVSLDENRRKFRVEFTLQEPGDYAYWFELADLQGFEDPESPRHEIHCLADQPPRVVIDEPLRDIKVTPKAVVPIKVSVTDDQGLVAASLVYRLSSTPDAAPRQTVLFRRPAPPRPTSLDQPARPDPAEAGVASPASTTLNRSHNFDLAELNLIPGVQVILHAEARDGFDTGTMPRVARSEARTLTLVDSEAKLQDLSGRLGELSRDLERLTRQQQSVRDQSGTLVRQVQKVGGLRAQEDGDLLKRIEMEQSEVGALLAGSAGSVRANAGQILEELGQNRIENPEMTRRLRRIVDELAALRGEQLDGIEKELIDVRKRAENHWIGGAAKDDAKKSAAQTIARSLEEAQRRQLQVLKSLHELARDLEKWRNQRDLTSDLRDLLAGQQEIMRQSREVEQRTTTKSMEQLSDQDRADLAKLGDRQKQLAELLQRLELQLRNQQAKEADPDAAATFQAARQLLESRNTVLKMQESSRWIDQNHLGDAGKAQSEIVEDLKSLERELQNPSQSADAEQLAKQLRQSESELEGLRQRQAENLETLRKTLKDPPTREREQSLATLRKKQQQLREETLATVRKLRRQDSSSAAASARRAADRMQESEQHLADKETSPNSVRPARESLDDLEQARRETARDRRRAEEQLAREQLEKIGDSLRGMVLRQRSLADETTRLNKERTEGGRWTRPLLVSLRNAAEQQRELQQEVARLADKLQGADVIALAMRGASLAMQHAAERLTERHVDAATAAMQLRAHGRLQRLIEVLEAASTKQESARAPGSNPPQAEPQNEPKRSNSPPGENVTRIAQFKVLRLLQEDLNRRTSEVETTRSPDGKLDETRKKELAELAGEQGRLMDIARELTAVAKQPAQGSKRGEPKSSKEKTKSNRTVSPPASGPSGPAASRRAGPLPIFAFSDRGAMTSLAFLAHAAPAPTAKEKQEQETKSRPAEPSPKDVKANPPPKTKEASDPLLDQLLGSKKKKSKTPPASPAKSAPQKSSPPGETKTVPPPKGGPRQSKGTGGVPQNSVADLLEQMKSSREQIAAHKTGKDTQKIQANILAQIDKVLEQQQNAPQNLETSGDDNQDQENNSEREQQQQKGKSASPQQNANSEGGKQDAGNMPTDRESANPAESEDAKRRAAQAGKNAPSRKDSFSDVWGHLPDRVRDRLMNLKGDRYLPKYDDLIRRYYESLTQP